MWAVLRQTVNQNRNYDKNNQSTHPFGGHGRIDNRNHGDYHRLQFR